MGEWSFSLGGDLFLRDGDNGMALVEARTRFGRAWSWLYSNCIFFPCVLFLLFPPNLFLFAGFDWEWHGMAEQKRLDFSFSVFCLLSLFWSCGLLSEMVRRAFALEVDRQWEEGRGWMVDGCISGLGA
jgi:hypothetical protein